MGSFLMLFAVIVISGVITSTIALKCYQCGMYNDGVGSITPCMNNTHQELKDCPTKNHIWCIKYVSGGSFVRDCVTECQEKEHWGTRTFCCDEDGCNSSSKQQFTIFSLIITAILVLHH